MWIILCANKLDLDEERKVSNEELTQFATEKGILFFMVSGTSGDNVSEMFQAAVDDC